MDNQSLIREAIEKYQEFYLLDLNKFKTNLRKFKSTFKKHIPNTQIAYSVKTNYLPELLKIVDKEGCFHEVVSEMEYDLISCLNLHPKKIICNGPSKSISYLEKAILNHSIINIDNIEEFDLIDKCSNKLNKTVSVALRLNTNIKSRFGIPVQQLTQVIKKCEKKKHMNLAGFHAHICPPKRDEETYRVFTKNVIDILSKYAEIDKIEFLNLGGGFLSEMPEELSKHWDYPLPLFEDYARVIGSEIGNSKLKNKTIFFEPGIALTADIMKYYCLISSMKIIDNNKVIGTTGSVYCIKPTKSLRNLPLKVYSENVSGEPSIYNIYGYTCMEDDVMYNGFEGSLSNGDILEFSNVGAYSIVLKPNFINPAPPIFTDNNGVLKTIRKKEKFKNVFENYNV